MRLVSLVGAQVSDIEAARGRLFSLMCISQISYDNGFIACPGKKLRIRIPISMYVFGNINACEILFYKSFRILKSNNQMFIILILGQLMSQTKQIRYS